jgi:hypothetical protein
VPKLFSLFVTNSLSPPIIIIPSAAHGCYILLLSDGRRSAGGLVEERKKKGQRRFYEIAFAFINKMTTLLLVLHICFHLD